MSALRKLLLLVIGGGTIGTCGGECICGAAEATEGGSRQVSVWFFIGSARRSVHSWAKSILSGPQQKDI